MIKRKFSGVGPGCDPARLGDASQRARRGLHKDSFLGIGFRPAVTSQPSMLIAEKLVLPGAFEFGVAAARSLVKAEGLEELDG